MIEIENVTKIYNMGGQSYQALNDVSLKIDDGEFVAIMGPSGSGKSTLMHIIGALDMPTTGKYLFGGKDVSQMDDDSLADIRKEKIGFVFQSFNLLPRATVLRNVVLPLIYSDVDKEKREEKAKECLKNAGLDESYYAHLSNQLSGGQIQRVAIARALVNDPDIILADEPTGNLDTKTGDVVLKTFQKLNADYKKTIILITHDQEVAEYADRIVVIRDGKIIQDSKNKKRV